MKTLRTKRIALLLGLSLICLSLIAFLQFSQKQRAYATSSDFYMIEKASIRLEERHGIRFATFIGEDSEQANKNYWQSHEMGTLFIPEKYLGDNELVLGGSYGGASPVVARFDGNVNNLKSDPAFEGGKLFNAVLELTDIDCADAFNSEIVARTYVKDTITNEVSYLNAVTKSPAYVAGMEIEADVVDEILDSYVKYVEIDNPSVFNVGAWVEVDGLKTNVKDIPVTYTIEKAPITTPGVYDGEAIDVELVRVLDNGKIEGLNEGDTTITVSALKGKISKSIPLTVSLPQVAFYSSNYTPTGIFTIRAKNVASVKFNDSELTFTYAGSVVTVNKSVLGDKLRTEGDYAFTITTTDGAVSTVPVYVREADVVDWREPSDKIGKLALLEGKITQLNIGDISYLDRSVSTSFGSNYEGAMKIARIGDENDNLCLNLNSELIKALLLDNQSKNGIQLIISADGKFSSKNFNYITESGNTEYTLANAGKNLNMGFSVAMSNKLSFGDQAASGDINFNVKASLGIPNTTNNVSHMVLRNMKLY